MPLYIVYLAAYLLGGVVAASVILLAGYLWGAFAGLQARVEHSPKWKTYLLVLLPPAALAAAFLADSDLSRFAVQVFLALAAPAFIGACLRYNRHRNGYSSV